MKNGLEIWQKESLIFKTKLSRFGRNRAVVTYRRGPDWRSGNEMIILEGVGFRLDRY